MYFRMCFYVFVKKVYYALCLSLKILMLLCELILLLQSCTVISDAADDIINVMITHAR
jgi:hypothetical protein